MDRSSNGLANVAESSGSDEKRANISSTCTTQGHSTTLVVPSDVAPKEKTLSFPLKRNNMLLQETPSIFEQQQSSEGHQSKNGLSHSSDIEAKMDVMINSPISDGERLTDDKKVETIQDSKKTKYELDSAAATLDTASVVEDASATDQASGHHKKKKKEKEKHKKGTNKKKRTNSKSVDPTETAVDSKEPSSIGVNKEGKTCSKRPTSDAYSDKTVQQTTTSRRHRSRSEQTTRKEKQKLGQNTNKGLVAYSSDDDAAKDGTKRPFPATLPRIHVGKSPTAAVSHSERASTSLETNAPKISKCTANSTWDSSDSDFDATVNKISPNSKTSDEVGVTEAKQHNNVSQTVKQHQSSSSSSSSCSSRSQNRHRSRKRRHSSRSYSRSYSRSRSYSSSSSRTSSSRSYSRSPVSSRRRRRSSRRRRRHSSSSSSSDRSRGRYSNRRRYRRRTSRSSSSSSRSSSTGRRRKNRHYSSDTSGGARKRSLSKTPPPVCQKTCGDRRTSVSGGILTVTRSPPESRLARLGVGPVGKGHGLISSRSPGHKTSETVTAAANAAVRKITGAAYSNRELSPRKKSESTPTDTVIKRDEYSQNTVGENAKLSTSASEDEANQTDRHAQYIGPQVPPEMAKKLGLSVEGSLEQMGTSSDAHWKAHVGAKRKSDRGSSDNCVGGFVKRQDNGDTKTSPSASAFDVFPPEKEEEYKALQAQAKEHALRRGQPTSTVDFHQQQAAAALAVQSTTLQHQQLAFLTQLQQQQAHAAVVSTAPVTVMANQPAMSTGILDQLRQQHQLYAMTGASGQVTTIEALIRNYQAQQQHQVESVQAAAQQQHMLHLFTLAQQHQQQQQAQHQAALLAAQQQQQPVATVISAAALAQQQALVLAAAQHQQQQVLFQRLVQRHQGLNASTSASPAQQQQHIQMLLQFQQQTLQAQQQQALQAQQHQQMQQQTQAGGQTSTNLVGMCAGEASAATTVNAISPITSIAGTGDPVTAVATSNALQSAQATATTTQPSTSSSPSMLAAVAAVAAQQRHILQNEQFQKEFAAAVLARTAGASLTVAQQQQHLFALQAAAVAAQQQRPQQQVGTMPWVALAAQQQAQQHHMAQVQALYQQQAAVSQQQAAALLAAQQQATILSRLMRPQ